MSSNTLVSGNVSEFVGLAKFETREQMDLAIRSFLYSNKHNLTNSEQAICKLCSQLAFKLKGVFFARHDYISKLIGVSSKTVQRAMKKLTELSFIEKHSTIRKSGGKGHNVYVIQPCEIIDFDNLNSANVQSNVPSEMSSRPTAQNTGNTRDSDSKNDTDSGISDSKSSKRIKNLVHKVDGDSFDISYLVAHYIPKQFITYAKLAFDNAKDINIAWHVLRKILKPLKGYSESEKLDFAIRTIGTFFQQFKAKKRNNAPIEKPFGYLKGICHNILDYEMKNIWKEMSTNSPNDWDIETDSEDILSGSKLSSFLEQQKEPNTFVFDNELDEEAMKLGVF
jgi:hypothetical protein